MKGATRVSVMLLVKAEFNAAIMKMLMNVRFAKVGFGIKESMFLWRDVVVVTWNPKSLVRFGAPALSSR